jgi:cytochrome c oxidase assembly protein subunit 11
MAKLGFLQLLRDQRRNCYACPRIWLCANVQDGMTCEMKVSHTSRLVDAVQICQQTGWSGQPVKAHDSGEDPTQRLKPVTDSRRLRITFKGNVSDVLPWKFTPQQREVRVLPGETALAFFTATNKSDADIIGVATYGVTPAQVAPYFSKIQCFCFEEQRLNAGETVDMPVLFFIDPDFVKDPAMRGIDTITLSYTFFSKS